MEGDANPEEYWRRAEKMKTIFVWLLMFSASTVCFAQTQKAVEATPQIGELDCGRGGIYRPNAPECGPEIIYEQQLANYRVVLEREHNTDRASWSLTAKPRKGSAVTLEQHSVEKNDGWRHLETVGESLIRLYNVITAFEADHALYIAHNKFGELSLARYSINGQQVKSEKKVFGSRVALGSLGGTKNFGTYTRIEGDIYLYLSAGQQFGGVATSLYKINAATFSVSQIKFSEAIAPIATMRLSEFSRRFMEQTRGQVSDWDKMTAAEKAQQPHLKPGDRSLKQLQNLQRYEKDAISYVPLDADRDRQRDQVTDWENTGLELYSMFKAVLSTNTSNLESAAAYLQEAIEHAPGKRKNKIKYHGVIEGKIFNATGADDTKLYFFYSDGEKSEVQIARYDAHSHVAHWLIGPYMERSVEEAIKDKP
jgi:hypothetical protein